MSTITFDTLKFANRLKEAGIKEKEAEAIVGIVQEAQDGAELATKRDLQQVKSELEIKMSEIEVKMSENKTELVKWVVTIGVLQTSIIAALVMKLIG